MDYQSTARPIRRWAMKNHGKPLIFDGREFHLELNELGSLNEKEGGMGIAYRCHYIEHGVEHKCWIKHSKIDKSTDSQIIKHLESGNAEIINEGKIQTKVHSLGFASEIIYTGKFAVYENEPAFNIIIQREAEGESLFDLKDKLTHTERSDLLKIFFQTLSTLHEENIYHSDLDLNHIYFNAENKKITLIDWGGVTLKKEGFEIGMPTTRGKPVFAPPEQRPEEDRKYFFPQSEIFSACAVAYYFLEDKKNGLDDSPDFAEKNYSGGYKLDDGTEISSSIVNAIKRGTKNNPDDRFDSIAELLLHWNDTSSELPSLIVKTTDNLESVNQINNTLFRNDLNFSFIGDEVFPSWEVHGDFRVLQTAGSMRGMWRDEKEILVVNKPMIIKSKTTDDYVLLRVENQTITDKIEEDENDSPEDTVMVKDKSSGEIFQLIGRSGDSITLENIFDGEQYTVTKEDYKSRFELF